jgi:hypothetical protein
MHEQLIDDRWVEIKASWARIATAPSASPLCGAAIGALR